MINEIVSLMTIYGLMAFVGDIVSEADTQNDIGFALICLTVLNFIENSVPIVLQVKDYCRRVYIRRKNMREHQKMLAQKEEAT